MNITDVLINNGQLGKISKEQRAGAWDVWQTLGIRVTEPSQVDDAIATALAHHGPSMVAVLADADLV
jgi:pyruvate oxidase